MTEPVAWIAAYAAQKGLKYEAEADERWLRAWEPFATLRMPARYEHALLSTGAAGSLTIARMVVVRGSPPPAHDLRYRWIREISCWIAIAQDERLDARAAMTSDREQAFGDVDGVAMPRRATGDGTFDRVFSAFAPSEADLARAVTPSLRKLLLSWGALPVHAEVRKGGFILAPVGLPEVPQSLSWLVRAVHYFGDKAAKRATA
jgi:hypothetical protein